MTETCHWKLTCLSSLKNTFTYINKFFSAKEIYSADCLIKDSEKNGGGFVCIESKRDKKHY